MTKRAAMTMVVLILALPAQQALAADEVPAPAAGAPAHVPPPPGYTRFTTRGGETVEGQVIDRLPNGYLVRLPTDTTRVVAYEDVAAIEGEPAPQAAPAPPPTPPVYAAPEPTLTAPATQSRRPPGDPADRLGHAGQIIIQQGFGFATHTDTRTTLSLSPAIDFLVSRIFTIGFRINFSHSVTSTSTSGGGESGSSNSTSATDVGGALSLGLLFSPSRVVSLWPNISGGIQHDFDGSGSSTVTSTSEFAILLHPARHFFIALKPGVRGSRSLDDSSATTDFTEVFSTGIGGWW